MECLGKVSDSLLQNDRRAERESYGRRLLPQVLDEHSRLTPERLYASVPYSADLSQGFRDITCRNMADATNAIAHWLQIKIGRSSCYEVLAYIGIPDLRTAILFLAGVKCGYRVSVAKSTSQNVVLTGRNLQRSYCFLSEILSPRSHRY